MPRLQLETLHYQVMQLQSRSLVFKRCLECNGKLRAAIVDGDLQDERQYCYEKCDTLVKDFKCNYDMKMTVLNLQTFEVENIRAFDEIAAAFIGCTANEYLKRLKNNDKLGLTLESLAEGMMIDVKANANTRSKAQNKAHSIRIVDDDHQDNSLISILESVTHLPLHICKKQPLDGH